jgi:hypothetical protein
VFQDQQRRIEGDGAREMCTGPDGRIERGDRPVEPVVLDTRGPSQRDDPRRDIRLHWLDVEGEGHREILQQRGGIQQHGSRAHDAEAIERLEPRLAVGDRGRAAPEDEHLPFIGQGGAGHEIDEHLPGARIEAGQRDPFPLDNREIVDAQRPQAVVGPPHVRDSENRVRQLRAASRKL